MSSCGFEQVLRQSSEHKGDTEPSEEKGVALSANNVTSASTAPRLEPKLKSIAPVFSTSDLSRWLNHYRALGFDVKRYGDEYGFASLDGVEIHVSVNPDHDPASSAGCAYVRVDDADALYARWSMVEGGHGPAPVDTEYGLREGGHIDPDGNLLRYGSSMGVVGGLGAEEKQGPV